MTHLAERSADQKDLAVLVDDCSDCGACLRQCAFLERYGSPAAIQQLYEQDSQQGKLAFSCSLCGLCNVVCPAELSLDQYFLAMRRHYIAEHPEHLKKYGGLRFYESIGTSKTFSHYALPANCTGVFFPGCALTGSRPERTWELYQHLRSEQPSLGLVLDCCTKPSHDLGDVDRFNEKFFPLRAFLENNGMQRP